MWRMAAALLVLCLLGACAPEQPDAATLLVAHRMAEEGGWSNAKPLLSECLHVQPRNAAGHWLLGRYYLSQNTPYVTPAENEFRLTLKFLEEGDFDSAFQEPLPKDELAIAAHIGICRCRLALARMLQAQGAPPDGVLAQVNVAFEEALAAKRRYAGMLTIENYFENLREFQKRFRADNRLPVEMV